MTPSREHEEWWIPLLTAALLETEAQVNRLVEEGPHIYLYS